MSVPTKSLITLASRDSLLALAQTIDAALRLDAAGLTVRIKSLKTAGDIKLDAPLYKVAEQTTEKEGRAFFTKELDEALLVGHADAAVHSFKDLPVDSVPGIQAPLLFSETTGADVLITLAGFPIEKDGAHMVVGTSSLRRIHQLRYALPAAKTVLLRGNVVTRLKKLNAGDAQMNAIVIAGAGLRRLQSFAALPVEKYTKFLTEELSLHLAAELKNFHEFFHSDLTVAEIPELQFPTAPGQGVLALQFSDKAAPTYAKMLRDVFFEHDEISRRVDLERSVMTELATGCHAPLGVSALRTKNKFYNIALCFSKKTNTDAVTFENSIYLRRQVLAASREISAEVKHGFPDLIWWGKDRAPTSMPNMKSVIVIEQKIFTVNAPVKNFDTIFVASPSVCPWLKEHATLICGPIVAAGAKTAAILKEAFPTAQITYSETGIGFAAALALIPKDTKLLWLGSQNGEDRARKFAAAHLNTEFLAVYQNIPKSAATLNAEYPFLQDSNILKAALHLVTAGTVAASFITYLKSAELSAASISCFGPSAAEIISAHGYDIYHRSTSTTFENYLQEIAGDATLMSETFAAFKDNQ